MPASQIKRAVILFSGGLDSTTCLALAMKEGYEAACLTFDYGQRHRIEVEAAKRLAVLYGVRHLVQEFDIKELAKSSLTASGDIPKGRSSKSIESMPEIPSTYVPARNTLFLSFALAWAETLGAQDIFFGANSIDYSGYPDCRPEFIDAYTHVANLGTKAGVQGKGFKIHTPLLHLTKRQIVEKAKELGVDVTLTHSCYDPAPDGRPCGLCDSCTLRGEGFAAAQLTDGYAPL